MKRSTMISLVAVLALLVSSFTFVEADSSSDSNDMINQFTSLNDNFLGVVADSEWVHTITNTEFANRPSVRIEDWYHLETGGKISEVYEWSTFGDSSTPSQESMMKNGIWMNFTSEQKWSATSTNLDFSAGFKEKLRKYSENNGKISDLSIVYASVPAMAFLYETTDGSNKDLDGVREVYYLDSISGKPLGYAAYQVNKNGTETLVQKTTYEIDTGSLPPSNKLKEIEAKANNDVSGYIDLHSGNAVNSVLAPAYTYYKTTFRSQDVTVSGLAITSYKQLFIYSSYWDGLIYTGTPSTILQQAGANWFSFQEYCNGTYYNIYISTTTDISTGVSNWARATGVVFYMSGCSTEHELYINGSHYAKYNYTIMNPSPDFAIWYPVALTN